MKWKNKGHEFDEYRDIFKPGLKVYIYGAGEDGAEVFRSLGFADCVKGFIDNNKDLKIYCGKPVETIIDFMKKQEEAIVIVAASNFNKPFMVNQLITMGYKEGVNLFRAEEFLRYYIGIYAMYSWDKLYFTSFSLTVTHKCNLNCKGCLAFVPLCKNPSHYDVRSFIESIDLLFKQVDFVGFFEMSGGETLLYPDIVELLVHIGENYRDRIAKTYITTNGTIVPSDKLCEVIKKYHYQFNIDDYSASIDPRLNKMDEIVRKLVSMGIDYHINKVEKWIDFAVEETDNSAFTEEDLVNYYVACQQEWPEIWEGRLYQCAYSTYATRAGIMPSCEDEAIDLAACTREDRMMLLEFSKGYSEKGYVELCKRCAGFWGINNHYIEPAQQIKR